MINNLRFELTFKNIADLQNKLNFCKSNRINNINIPCKGHIKKELYKLTFEYIKNNYEELNVVYHYSLYHQYSKNKENSYHELLDFIEKCNSYKNYEILLISGSNKKKDFDVINVLSYLKEEEYLKIKLGIAYNPYLKNFYNNSSERDRYEQKISTGLVNSVWFQFGTDMNLLKKEVKYINLINKQKKLNLFGSILIPSKEFVARFKFRPWKEVYIADKYLNNLKKFYVFAKDLINFYLENNITPVIETDFASTKRIENLYSFLKY